MAGIGLFDYIRGPQDSLDAQDNKGTGKDPNLPKAGLAPPDRTQTEDWQALLKRLLGYAQPSPQLATGGLGSAVQGLSSMGQYLPMLFGSQR